MPPHSEASSSTLTPAQSYNGYLSSSRYGQAIWCPYIPGGKHPDDVDVQIGDVGYFNEGEFHRCFNIFHRPNHWVNRRGVPVGFKTLRLNSTDLLHYPRYLVADEILTSGNLRTTGKKRGFAPG